MKKYRVRLGGLAFADLDSILTWGTENWGAEEAGRWLDEFEVYVNTRLSEMPLAYPFAPEGEEFEFEVRQLIYGRYRVLFRHDAQEVLVLRVRGPYTSPA